MKLKIGGKSKRFSLKSTVEKINEDDELNSSPNIIRNINIERLDSDFGRMSQ